MNLMVQVGVHAARRSQAKAAERSRRNSIDLDSPGTYRRPRDGGLPPKLTASPEVFTKVCVANSSNFILQ